MKHKKKRKVARKMMNKDEEGTVHGLFQSKEWLKRREALRIKELVKKYGNDWNKRFSPEYVKVKSVDPLIIKFKPNSKI